jgi:hypothetical protein
VLWHLYLVAERGGQHVWVYSPPSDCSKWVYDKITGDKGSYEPKLEKTTEVYSADQRKVISTALAFSDEPIDRSGGGWKDYAFVDPTETLQVIYAQGAFLRAAGSTGRVWLR